ncbi:MAG: hypothetical protein JXR37_08850 [Kiritimatiellae bacterium]|nr:hypothetical protein [Kiritimatiellia bacterium]
MNTLHEHKWAARVRLVAGVLLVQSLVASAYADPDGVAPGGRDGSTSEYASTVTFMLRAAAGPNGQVSPTLGSYEAGTTGVVVRAAPADGHHFLEWELGPSEVVLRSEWGNPGYQVVDQWHSLADDVLTLHATVVQRPGLWMQMMTPFAVQYLVPGLPAGVYGVRGVVNGRCDPSDVTVEPVRLIVRDPAWPGTINPLVLTMDQSYWLMATFERDVGTIAIDVTPDEGHWVIVRAPFDYQGQREGTGDLASTPAPAGRYAIRYESLPRHTAPTDCVQVVTHGTETRFEGTYTPEPATLYVSKTGSNEYPYADWGTAATDIQRAVDAAHDGDIVLVGSGVYSCGHPIGVEKGIVVRSAHGPSETIIDGTNATRCVYLSHSNAIVEGFTIRNGSVYDPPDWAEGGGVLLTDGELRRCQVEGNTADCGGGLCCSGRAKVSDCLIVRNMAHFGGGVACYGIPHVEGCTIFANQADEGGGVWICTGGHVSRSIICGNVGLAPWENIGWAAGSLILTCYENCCGPRIPGINNIDADPMFAAVESGDYHLRPGSPCLDALGGSGSPSPDLDGISRPLDGDGDGVARLDIGAYEFVCENADTDGDGVTDGREVHAWGTDPARVDTDGDSQTDSEELIAGTDPTDEGAVFEVGQASINSSGILRLSWTSVSGRTYAVYRSLEPPTTDNQQQWHWVADQPATPPQNVYAVPASPATTAFYQIRVEMADQGTCAPPAEPEDASGE